MDEHHKILKMAGERTIKNLQFEWWKNIDKENSKFIEGLINRIATVIKDITPKNNDVNNKNRKININSEILNKIQDWIEKESPKDFDDYIKNLKRQIQNLKEIKENEFEKDLLEKQTSNVKKSNNKMKKDEHENNNPKQTHNLEKLEEKINKNFLNISTMIETILRNNEAEKIQIENYYNARVEELNLSIEKLEKLAKENQRQNSGYLIEIKDSNALTKSEIKTELNSIQEKMKQKIDIKESMQILEIKTEIERYTTSEMIIKISKVIMPIIASIKTQDGMQDHEGIKLLEEKCLSLGLLSIERIYG